MFITDDFCLQSDLAITLYQSIKDAPIIDYHNHLSAEEIYKNEPYENITDLWLKHDHYKWRLMRSSGIDEEYITGNASKKDKFLMYAKALENAYMNPLYHWSHMELKEYFGITDTLTYENAEMVYHQINQHLKDVKTGPIKLLQQRNVEALCTTDDLNDDLHFHRLIKLEEQSQIKVLPTFRPDSLFRFNNDDFFDVIKLLEQNTELTISDMASLKNALSKRLDYFQKNGTVVADHGLTTFRFAPVKEAEASTILKKRLKQDLISEKEIDQLTTYLLGYFIEEYKKRSIVCQLHFGALRDTNKRMFEVLGKDAGYDSIGHYHYVNDLNKLLNHVEYSQGLPKMIIYNLHPKDYEALASLCANFSRETPGKIQLGAAWWFNDNMRGILRQIEAFGEYLNLSTMIGMLTDSRSFLSFVRHDYYRRILADFIASQVILGYIPKNITKLKKMLNDISYFNSKEYFKL